MADTSIEWTSKTWNPVVGCEIVSAGCRSCYAMRMAARLEAMGQANYAGLTKKVNGKAVWTGKARYLPSKLTEPFHWRVRARIFVNSMSDLFHEDVPDQFIRAVFGVMSLCRRHTFQILTKRPERMRALVSSLTERDCAAAAMRYPNVSDAFAARIPAIGRLYKDGLRASDMIAVGLASSPKNEWNTWPAENIWLGVSVEDQKTADERIPLLLQTPASVRFVSYEPALSGVDFSAWLRPKWGDLMPDPRNPRLSVRPFVDRISWVIVGGESGPGARLFDIQWARDTIRQCREAGVACFVKQLGSKPVVSGDFISEWPLKFKDNKGGSMEEWPEDLRIRQFPETRKAVAA